MLFAAPLFLTALAAVSVPIIIHLIYRLKKRQVIFGTLRFLKIVQQKNARMLQIREILLLLLRIAAFACIALAFARPFLSGSEVEARVLSGRTDMVFVLDDTFSMSAVVGGRTLLKRAKDRIVEHIKRLRNTDRVGLVLVSEPRHVKVRLTSESSEFVNKLRGRSVPQTFHGGSLVPAVKTAANMMVGANSQADNRIVVIVSDLQTSAWDTAAFLADDDEKKSGIRYEVVALEPAGDNLAVVDAKLLSQIFVDGQPVPVSARVANFGKADQKRLIGTLRQFDRPTQRDRPGYPIAKRAADVDAGQIKSILLRAPLPAAGEVAGAVEIEGRDHLAGDDRRYWAANLRERIKVLLVEDELVPNARYDNVSNFIRVALDPFEDTEEAGGGRYIAVRSIQAPDLNRADIKWADVVFLCSLTRLSNDLTDALTGWVAGGGGLVVFLGGERKKPATDWMELVPARAWYDGPIYTQGVLPARPTRPEGEVGAFDHFKRITKFDGKHFICLPFQGEHSEDLARPRIYRYYTFAKEDVQREGVTVIARLNTGEPFLLEKAHEKGRTLLFATGPGVRWSELPKRKVFVPLLHQCVRYLTLARGGPGKNYEVGDAIDFGVASGADAVLTLHTPDGGRREMTSGDPVTAREPGIYVLSVRRGTFLEKLYAAVNVPASESDLTAYSAEEVAKALGRGEVDDPSKVRTTKIREDSPDELKRKAKDWRSWLIAGMILLLIEALLANVFMRAK